jgi:transposase-like protein
MTRGTRYPAELRERAVRLVYSPAYSCIPSQWAALTSIATTYGMTPRRGVSELR